MNRKFVFSTLHILSATLFRHMIRARHGIILMLAGCKADRKMTVSVETLAVCFTGFVPWNHTLTGLSNLLCDVAAATQPQPVQFIIGSNGVPTSAILTGVGAEATFQNTDGQVVEVTNNSPGSVTIPIDSNGKPSIPSGAGLTVVSNNPSIPSASSSSSPTTAGWHAFLPF